MPVIFDHGLSKNDDVHYWLSHRRGIHQMANYAKNKATR